MNPRSRSSGRQLFGPRAHSPLLAALSATLLLGACADEMSGQGDPATAEQAVRDPRHDVQAVKTIEEDKALGADLVAANRAGIIRDGTITPVSPGQFQMLASTGIITEGGRACRISAGLHDFFREMLDTGKRFQVGSMVRPGAGPHGLSGDQVEPPIAECVGIAVDISAWDVRGPSGYVRKSIDLVHLDDSADAAVDILASLPPGKYTMGLLRAPYPATHPRAEKDFTDYGYFDVSRQIPPKRNSPLWDQTTHRLILGHEPYYKFFHSFYNEMGPCIVRDSAPPDAFPPGAPRSPTPCSTAYDELAYINDPGYRARLIDATAGAESRDVRINFYGDALDHIHVAVENLRPGRYARGDMNSDGKPDLVWYNQNTTETRLWIMDGLNRRKDLPMNVVGDANWAPVATADFDGDWQNDILWYNRATGVKSVWFMNGKSLKRHQEWPTPGAFDAGWVPVAIGDFNADRSADIVWYHGSRQLLRVTNIDGNFIPGLSPCSAFAANGTCTAPYMQSLGTLIPTGVGDIDRDGLDELVLWDTVSTTQWIVRPAGGAWNDFDMFRYGAVFSFAWVSRGLADFDLDGILDTYFYSPNTDTATDPQGSAVAAGTNHWVMRNGDAQGADGTVGLGALTARGTPAGTGWIPARL